ncbi:MAG: glycosyltransferase [Hyphomicrobiaceae bacterium]
MRFLFTCVPGLGHFNPAVPLARALEQAGHSVAFVTAPRFAEAVKKAGFECLTAGLDWDERRIVETVPDIAKVESIFHGWWIMGHLFLDRSPRQMVPDLLTKIIPQWRPDMIISGSFEYGGPLAAEKAGLPYATVNYTIRWSRWILKHMLRGSMKALRKEVGLPADPQLKAFGRYLDLWFSPPSWTYQGVFLRPVLTRQVRARILGPDLPLRERWWGFRLLLLQLVFTHHLRKHPNEAVPAPNTHFIREDDCRTEKGPPPEWLQAMPRQPTVFISLGTVLSARYPDIFAKILEGMRDQPVNLVITLGGNDDPDRFGPQPPNVRIVRFMTQDELRELFPHVDLCINHAGYSSVMEALTRGIPLILLPLVTDAPMNTQMCQADGIAADLPPQLFGLNTEGLPILKPDRLTPAILRDTIMRALTDPSYRTAAHAMQDTLSARPGPDVAVAMLEQIARAGAGGAR